MYLFVLAVSLSVSSCSRDNSVLLYDLSHAVDSYFPDDCKTTFTWKIKSGSQGFEQHQYQLEIIDASGKKVFNSDWVLSNVNSVSIKNEILKPGNTYKWKVKIAGTKKLGADLTTSNWSSLAEFEAPLVYPESWQAEWISFDSDQISAMPVFFNNFGLKNHKAVKGAKLHISGLGFYEAMLNGKRIGNHVLDPGQTNYDDFAFYETYIIDPELFRKENCIEVFIGDGWFNQNVVWHSSMAYGKPILIAQLEINYKNGTSETIGTGDNWKYAAGPVISSNLHAGEVYDARIDRKNNPSHQALPAENIPPRLIKQLLQPMRIMDSLSVQKISSPSEGVYVFDFGQNLVGWCQLNLTNAAPGQEIKLRFTEEIDETGNVDPTSTGVFATKVEQEGTYICNGSPFETWQPRFVYHGFRYVEVRGLVAEPTKDMLKAMVVYTDMPPTGTFLCSDEHINKLHQMNVWTIKGNIQGIPTDCPHREKCGWTGDVHVVAKALMYNFDAHSFLKKYMYDCHSSAQLEQKTLYFSSHFFDRSIRLKPKGIPFMCAPGKRRNGIASPDWGTVMVQVPWNLYVYYADKDILKNLYPEMKLWFEFVNSNATNNIVEHGLGDWCPPGGNAFRDCPIPLSSTAFHFYDAVLMAKISKVLENENDYLFFNKMKTDIKEAFNIAFFDSINSTYGSQTANILTLAFGLVPENKVDSVAQSLVSDIYNKHDGFLHTGIFGLGRIFETLSNNGQQQAAFDILTKKGYNSFEYMYKHYGATTMREVLPIDDYYYNPEKNDLKRSHNHLMNASFDKFFYNGIGGIAPLEEFPGFKQFVLKPRFTGLMTWAKVSYNSVNGKIISNWENTDDGKFLWEISIPDNSIAQVSIPVSLESRIAINGEFLSNFEVIDNYTVMELVAGNYLIEVD